MNPAQICPHCGQRNRVAGLHTPSPLFGKPAQVICGYCGERFPAQEEEREQEEEESDVR